MDAAILVSIISASASIAVAGLTFFLTKRKEREADWKKQKLEHYREFLEALNGVVIRKKNLPPENHLRWAKACNTVGLVASQTVLAALWQFQEATSKSNTNTSPSEHDRCLNQLILAIRADLGIRPKDDPEAFKFRLWSSD
ncbi:hypothetical protein FHW67_001956 [Herbaspirillum sp. Sphag1AN]|uniref:hypothetical protein n=1 Tax=unclassified Herbaspirillum TaxID=2624150 RepID=UPI0016113BF3|nr:MULTISPECIES: hypothetical protein [unclassified Herbaspirillum]MBB3212673.1 hypothetical protein [Herbaspirillum sp. Sphag1AN]MBB3245870.1 hypothetical protein [Herbaspirillum sp. Sphag64]